MSRSEAFNTTLDTNLKVGAVGLEGSIDPVGGGGGDGDGVISALVQYDEEGGGDVFTVEFRRGGTCKERVTAGAGMVMASGKKTLKKRGHDEPRVRAIFLFFFLDFVDLSSRAEGPRMWVCMVRAEERRELEELDWPPLRRCC